jgi:nitroreductase
MDAYKAIITRRSIRKFEDRAVPEEVVRQLLEAAMQAPSAVNKQPWYFVVIDERELLSKLPEINPNAGMAADAPCAILVCGDTELVHGPGYLPQDCSAATQNILLAAHALGLGAVWCGIYSREEREAGTRTLLRLPDSIVPFSLIVLGYPAETPRQPERYIEERVHRNGW